MYATALPQMEPPSVGVHLLWMGPHTWIYSLDGWSIQRREARERSLQLCASIDGRRISEMSSGGASRLEFGLVTVRQGMWPVPLRPAVGAAPPQPCMVLTLTLDSPQSHVSVDAGPASSFVLGLRGGKAVAWGGPAHSQSHYDLQAPAMDSVVVYGLDLNLVTFCIAASQTVATEEQGWADVPYIVKGLQLPLRELQPALGSAAAEYAQAQSRLFPGEALDEAEFAQLADILRAAVSHARPPRPIDEVLLLREDASADFDEMVALDPLRALLSQPRWRRVLAFAFFDHDPTLMPGKAYEYRITGTFPAADLSDRVYGFHTAPSQTLLPTDFFLSDLHLRLAQPTGVQRSPGTAISGTTQITRRGIALANLSQKFWLMQDLDGYSLVVDFPRPITRLELELAPGHSLGYSAIPVPAPPLFLSPPPTPENAVPAGSPSILTFAAPVQQVRLRGTGFLHAIRIPSGATGIRRLTTVLPPVTLLNTPRPPPPLTASISNLQQTPVPAKVVLTPQSSQPAPGPSRHELGFEVDWIPATGLITVWPIDVDAAPPLEATTFALEHRQAPDSASVPAATWNAVLDEENTMLGDRDRASDHDGIRNGDDVMTLYPELRRRASGGALNMYWRDVFDFEFGQGSPVWRAVRRPVPAPGTYHQYRVFSIDPIGRPSPTGTETNILRLEKRLAPPVPVGPEAILAAGLPVPTGVQARVLVRGQRGMSVADQMLLGASQNAIVLRWGWHSPQRSADPYATEFRVYFAATPLDSVKGTLTSVKVNTLAGFGDYQVTLDLDRSVNADAAQGLYLEAGYPFYIRGHTGGSTIVAEVESHVSGPLSVFPRPPVGPIALPLPLSHDMTRPPAWSERVEVQPITAAESYQTVFRNRLTLTPEQPQDSVWVGVSSADSEVYVGDHLAPAQDRPGNESAVVPVRCEGRYHGRPVFGYPPALAPVPVVHAPEPADRPLAFPLDLTPYLNGLGAGDRVMPERVAADVVFAAYYATNDGRVMARAVDPLPGDTDHEISIANPADHAELVAALRGARTDALEDRFVVYLAGSHPYRARLFEPAQAGPVAFAAFTEILPPKPSRYVYRVRKADAAGHLSQGDAVAHVVVRVPSLVPGAAPERVTPPAASPPLTLGLRVPPDPELVMVLGFSETAGNTGAADETDIMRIPNRPDLYATGNGLLLRGSNGALLRPTVKSLSDPDVSVDADGFRRLTLTFSAAPGERVRIWTFSLTRDEVPSLAGGPWNLAMPLAPLPIPALSVMAVPEGLVFSWAPVPFLAWLERSSDGVAWERVSALVPENQTELTYAPPTGAWEYRLAITSLDGRVEHSNIIAA